MRNINIIEIKEDDSGLRIDKWFKQKYPNANFGYIHKLVRTGQIRLNGGRVKANIRIKKGDCLRIPPIIKTDVENSIIKIKNLLNDSEVRKLQDYIIFHDDNHLILNKPFVDKLVFRITNITMLLLASIICINSTKSKTLNKI